MLAALTCLVLVAPLHPHLRAPQSADAQERVDADEFLKATRQRLASHRYFSKVALVEDRSAQPIAMWLQRPQVESPDWQSKLAAAHGPWLTKLESEFREVVAGPLRLERRSDTPLSVVCVLQTAGDFANYSENAAVVPYYGYAAAFERRSRWTVTFDSGGRAAPQLRRRAECGEFVRALFQAHYVGGGGEPADEWLIQGLAGYMVDGLGAAPESLDARAPQAPQSSFLVDVLTSPRRTYLLRPLAGFFRTPTFERYYADCADLADQMRQTFDNNDAYRAYHFQATLWTHFLRDAGNGRHRARYERLLGDAARGRGGESALRGAFDGLDLDELDRSFYRWLVELDRAARPQIQVDPRLVEEPFGPLPETASAPSRAPAAPPKPAPPSMDLAALRPLAVDTRAQHGRALLLATAGHYAQAAAELRGAIERAAGSGRERAPERELVRVEALQKARDAVVAEKIAAGTKVSFELPEGKLAARIERVEGDFLMLGENRLKLARLPLSEIKPAWIVRDLPKGFEPAWVRAYAQLLAGDERWKRAAGDAKELAELKADALDGFDALLAYGVAADELEELANRGLPVDAAGAGDCVQALERLIARHGAAPLVRDRREALGRYAELVLKASFTPELLTQAFPGRFEFPAAGRVRWTLSFDDEAVLQVFDDAPGALAQYRGELPALSEADAKPRLEVADGKLSMVGAFARTLPLGFTAPSSLRVTARHLFLRENPPTVLLMLACYANDTDNVSVSTEGNMVVNDTPSGAFEKDWDRPRFTASTDYSISVEVAEDRTRVSVNGVQTSDLPNATRTSGRFGVFVHCEAPILLRDLVLEGQLDVAATAAEWTARRRRQLGL